MVLISIAMATYNGEKYLKEQLDSILEQSYPIYEIVIVDDCSTDGTFSILQDYAQKFSNITVLQNESNLGVRKTFEKALLNTSGDYVALSDQDDVWLKDKVKILLDTIGDAMVVHSDSIIVDHRLQVLAKSHFLVSKKLKKSTFFDYLLNSNITGCTMMVSRDLLDNCLPFRTYSLPHDWYLTYYAAYKNSIKFVSKPLMYYRQHGSNVSGIAKKTFEEYIQSNREIATGIHEILKDSYFEDNLDAKFMIAYKNSVWQKKLMPLSTLSYLLDKKNTGIKMLVFYLIMLLPPRGISKRLYNLVRRVI